jgi:hypothetical protein
MASPETTRSLAKEMLDDDNLEEAEGYLVGRLEKHMAAKNTARVVAVSALITKIRAARAKAAKDSGE